MMTSAVCELYQPRRPREGGDLYAVRYRLDDVAETFCYD
jgi:hypothetical protein